MQSALDSANRKQGLVLRRIRKWTLIFALGLVALGAVFAFCIYHPRLFFLTAYEERGLVLRSDAPFESGDAARVLGEVVARLKTSPVYDTSRRIEICICNTRWRRALFFAPAPKAGGLHYYGADTVFLSGADMAAGILISPAGVAVKDERTLAYFITHEITHAMAEPLVGLWAYHRLTDWVKEGYADYVGRGSVAGRAGSGEAFLKNAPEMNWPVQAPYLRFNFLVGSVLSQQGWDVARLHREPRAQKLVEEELRARLQAKPAEKRAGQNVSL